MRSRDTVVKEYSNYISRFDAGGDLKEGVDYTLTDLLYAAAPIESTVTSEAPYVKDYDSRTRQRTIFRPLSEEELAFAEENNYDDDSYADEEFTVYSYRNGDNYTPVSDSIYGAKEFFNVNPAVKPVSLNELGANSGELEFRIDSNIVLTYDSEKSVISKLNYNNKEYNVITANNKIVGFKNTKGSTVKFLDNKGKERKVEIEIPIKKILESDKNNPSKFTSTLIIDSKILSDRFNNLFNDPCK